MPVIASCAGNFPTIVKTRGGALFAPHLDVWEIREPNLRVKLQFNTLPDLGIHFEAAFRSTLVWYAQNVSLSHLRNMFYWSSHLFKIKADTSKSEIVEITSVDLLNFRSHVGPDKECSLGALSGFIKRWWRLGYVGIAKDAYTLLTQIRLKGNPKGVATATMDPVSGPFTPLELEALQMALNNAYAQHAVSLEEYVLCWLVMMLGQRPTQYAALKVRDVVVLHTLGDSSTYSVRMPRAKRRDSDTRGAFKDRVLTTEIGALVARYAAEVQVRFTGTLVDPLDAPLFPGGPVDAAITGFAFHQTSAQIGNKINAAMARLQVRSERTGEPIHIGPKRFRSTVGTRAAEEGHGELVIAELLDHSDTQNVGVYVSSTPAIVERIDRAVAMQLAPLAQAFAGKLIGGPLDSSRSDDPASQLRAPGITGTFDAISSCGKHGFCGFLKPIACYTCTSFEPWLDGPHEQILKHLIVERERLMTVDTRIAAINDRAILAVAEVIQLCEAGQAARDTSNV